MTKLIRGLIVPAAIAGLSLLAACQNGTPLYTVGGNINNLASGQTVTIENDGGDPLTITANGAFEFTDPVPENGAYQVTVVTQPLGQICTVSNGMGSGVTGNVSRVSITCSAETYTVGGTLSGLASGAHVVLANSGQDPITLSADGAFTFDTPVAYNGAYAVTVTTQPSNATCTVSRGLGAGVVANVTNVSVTCSENAYSIGGTVTGLASGMQVTLDDNGADALTVASNGAFTFTTPVAAQGSYRVTVGTQPVEQTCSVSEGAASDVLNNITSVQITCSTDTYTISGSVAGLASGAQVTLDDNGADALTVAANGSFTFTTPIPYGGGYAVTVGTQPNGEYCTVADGTGSSVTATQSGVSVSCQSLSYSTAGSYTFIVPEGITSLQIVATGAGGGGGGLSGTNAGSVGGGGAVVTSAIAVTPGQVLSFVVGGGGGGGTDGPGDSNGYTCGTGGGGGGSTNVAVGAADQIIAGGGGGGGSCNSGSAGGSGGGANGAGGAGASQWMSGGGSGGANGVGGIGGNDGMDDYGINGSSGAGGPGGTGGYNGPYAGGIGGSGVGSGAGGADNNNDIAGGGGGGYGGGGSGVEGTGGGAGGSVGPSGTQYAAATNGGASGSAGSDGSVVINMN
jgi:hypothetical protein